MKNVEKLEERVIDFTVMVNKISTTLPKTRTCFYLSDQIIRSSISTSLNYAEARNAESRKDFIHKMKIVLKELRETIAALKIITKLNLNKDENVLKQALNENNELISIFVKSIDTARKNIDINNS